MGKIRQESVLPAILLASTRPLTVPHNGNHTSTQMGSRMPGSLNLAAKKADAKKADDTESFLILRNIAHVSITSDYSTLVTSPLRAYSFA